MFGQAQLSLLQQKILSCRGEENIFIFGMHVEDVVNLQRRGYNALDFINKNKELTHAIDQIETGYFTPDKPDLLKDLANSIKYHDR